MPLFYYRVGREDGSVFDKEVEAESEDQLRRELEDGGYLILQLARRRGLGLGLSSFGLRKKQKSEEFLVFNQELLALLKAGLPIVQSLDILMERTQNPVFKDALIDIKTEIRGGKALSDAMANHPNFFAELYTNSLKAGERTGDLPRVIERYIDYIKRIISLKRQVKSAVTYPAFLIIITTIILAVLLTYVVPRFSETYTDFKAELPLPTLILMNFTKVLKKYFILFIGTAVACVYFLKAWYGTERGRRTVDAYLLKIPLLGDLLRGYITSMMARTLATILAGGIPMLQALEMVAKAVTNREFAVSLRYVQERVREGISLASALEETKILPNMTIRMIEVGEATGALETMLNDISTFYEEEVNVRIQGMTRLIEPVIMLGMGLVFGAIIIVMYLPIFELAGTVK